MKRIVTVTMAVTPAEVKWSNYTQFEGPIFGGRQRYVLPPSPSENDMLMMVITAAEGGHYDAVNMYDAGIVSVGLIQWINSGQHNVDNMLGRVAEQCGLDKVTGPLQAAMALSGATFKKNQAGLWRFFTSSGEVNSNEQQRQLFMKGCGPKGTWTPEAREHAKTWAAGLATIWEDPGARKAQVDFTAPKLRSFLASDVQKELYDGKPFEGWVGATRATLVHFAVNMPAWVAREYRSYAASATTTKWSSDWCIGLIKQVTFAGPATGIWLLRYNSIRPVLESLFGVKLPRTTKELKLWQPTGTEVPVTSPKLEPVVSVPVTEPAVAPVIFPDFPVEPVKSEPATTPDAPLVPVNSVQPSLFASIWGFIMMLINLFSRRGK